MKKVMFFFTLFIVTFTLTIKVNAKIGDGINGGNKDYVYKDALIYDVDSSKQCTGSGGGYLGCSYLLKYDTNASTYCIDPGLNSPYNIDYHYYRELDLSTSLDQDFYNVYKFYVQKYNEGWSEESVRRNTDVVLRTIVSNYGFDLGNDKATRDEQYFGVNGIMSYIKGNTLFKDINWNLGGNTKDKYQNCSYWANTSDLTQCEAEFSNAQTYYKGYLEFINSKSNSPYSWKNTITITPTVKKYTEGDKNYYKFNFEINFKEDDKNFFDYSDYDNGYGMKGYFSYSLSNINDYYDLPGNTTDYSGDGYITNAESLTDGKLNVYAVIEESMYNAIKDNDPNGNVYIKLNYEYYHPLSDENVYVNSYQDTKINNTIYQRMVVFSNFIHHDFEIAGDKVTEDDDPNKCVYKDNKFYGNDGTEVDINKFIEDCKCYKVPYDDLTQTQKDAYDNSSCRSEGETINVENNLKACTGYNNSSITNDNNEIRTENYNIKYTKTTVINNYCNEVCTETVDFNDVAGKYTTKAGRYFELGVYPNLKAEKNCNVKIYYNDYNDDEGVHHNGWETDYGEILDGIVNAYNDWQKEKNTTEGSEDCNCTLDSNGRRRCDKNYYYTYSYTPYERNGVSISNGTFINQTVYNGCGNGKKTIDVESKKNAFINSFSGVENLISDLYSCSTILSGDNNRTTDQMFYAFKQKLNYYYQQTYADSSIGDKWNNERVTLNNIDDSEFKYTETITPSQGNYKITPNTGYQFSSMDSDGSIKTNYLGVPSGELNRSMTYSYVYEHPKEKKYVDSYTRQIASRESSLNNPIELGYVYDIDITALPKNINQNKFVFSALGDKNQIYTYYSNNRNTEALVRKCDYKIVNDIMDCEDDCPDTSKIDMNPVFRIVDNTNIDPNNRFGTSEGFKNWDNEKGIATKESIEKSDTFNPNNLEYSFTLDSATIKAIRDYNQSFPYSNFSSVSCNDLGNECISNFITYANTESSTFNEIKFATNISGRDKWKYLNYNARDGYIISSYKKDEANYDALKRAISSSGLNP